MKNNKLNFISISNIFEWYDFALYGFFIPYIAPLFFPADDRLVSYIAGFGVFSIGFFSRILGGMLFGYLGDKYGRKLSLLLSLIIMGVSTCCIGLLPYYKDIGIYSPILLIILRFIQGGCLGGEYCASVVYVSEIVKDAKYKATYVAYMSSFGLVGWFLGNFISTLFIMNDILHNWWRVPFLLGIVITIISFMYRKKIDETKDFLTNKKIYKEQLKESYTSYFIKLLPVILWGFFISGVFYLQYIFLNTYLLEVLHIDKLHVKLIITLGLFVYMICMPIMGFFSDQFGGSRVILFGSIALLIISQFVYPLINSGNIVLIYLVEIVISVILSTSAAMAYWITRIFPTEKKQYNLSLGYNIGVSLGSVGPLLGMSVMKYTNSTYLLSIFLSLCGVVGIVCALLFYQTVYKLSKNRIIMQT